MSRKIDVATLVANLGLSRSDGAADSAKANLAAMLQMGESDLAALPAASVQALLDANPELKTAAMGLQETSSPSLDVDRGTRVTQRR